jgi:hypothetical protein
MIIKDFFTMPAGISGYPGKPNFTQLMDSEGILPSPNMDEIANNIFCTLRSTKSFGAPIIKFS